MVSARKKLAKDSAEHKVSLGTCHCLGQCKQGPNIQVEDETTRKVVNKMSPYKLEQEIQALSEGRREPVKRVSAKNELNNLLSGGF